MLQNNSRVALFSSKFYLFVFVMTNFLNQARLENQQSVNIYTGPDVVLFHVVVRYSCVMYLLVI